MDKTAVIHGGETYTYGELYRRCRRLASALKARGVGHGDTVSVMAPNVPAMLEAHYGVPMLGAVLNALNYRLDAPTIAFIMEHAETKVLITDREFSPVIGEALKQSKAKPLVIDIDDALAEGGELLGEKDYEAAREIVARLRGESEPELELVPESETATASESGTESDRALELVPESEPARTD